MIRQSQVVINCFRHTEKLLFMSFYDGIVGKLTDGIHGVVSSDIYKGINLQLVQNIKNSVIYLHVFMNFREFITTGSQKSGRGSL